MFFYQKTQYIIEMLHKQADNLIVVKHLAAEL